MHQPAFSSFIVSFFFYVTTSLLDSLDRSAVGVTSISLLAWYGWKADAELSSLVKGSGLWVPVELALVPSPPLCGSCSSYTATSWRDIK